MVEIEYAVKMWEESCESNVLHDSNICTNLDYFVNICKYHNMKISSIERIANKILSFRKKLYTSNMAINFVMTKTKT